jgi:hypothetical protein
MFELHIVGASGRCYLDDMPCLFEKVCWFANRCEAGVIVMGTEDKKAS